MKAFVALSACLLLAACGPRPYAVWSSGKPMRAQVGECADVEAWVSKSGKQGIMVTLFLHGVGEKACTLDIRSASFETLGVTHQASRLPPQVDLHDQNDVYLFVPFPFDDNTAWNLGAREGRLAIDVGGTKLEWKLAQTEQTANFACETHP